MSHATFGSVTVGVEESGEVTGTYIPPSRDSPRSLETRRYVLAVGVAGAGSVYVLRFLGITNYGTFPVAAFDFVRLMPTVRACKRLQSTRRVPWFTSMQGERR